MHAVESRTIAKVSRRLVPFLIICYFVAYLDRVNVGFAALTMNQDLGLSQTAFGFGAGIFFIAYFIFEVPSNLLLERFGARKWIARIMLSWGILSGAMALLPAISRATGLGNEYSFYLLRVLLGAAEAGFFPGIIFYLTLWFPAEYRARIVGYFMAAIPLSTVIGAPISGVLLYLHGGLGLAGWQWLFIIEAVPAIILAGVVFFYLTDRPSDAEWLEPDERSWLAERLAIEQRQREAVRTFTVAQSLVNPRLIGLSLVYFGAVATQLRLELLPAADRQGVRPQHISHDSGLGRALPCRSDRHGMVGPPLRSPRRAAIPHRVPAVRCGGRHRRIDRTRRSDA
jgi:ACS family tartrate transporter-like MFS transporter